MGRVNRSRWNVQYMQKVLATDPIAHWMQDEKGGIVAYDMVTARSDGARNGACTAVNLGQPGIGDGRTAPFFDGATSFNNIFTPSFDAAFNGSEGSALIWGIVSAAGVWTDGTTRECIRFLLNNDNNVRLIKTPNNNQLRVVYEAGAVSEITNIATSTLDWFSIGVTWSAVADEVLAFFNGPQSGAIQNGLGVWAAGGLSNTQTLIGAGTTGPVSVWSGRLAHGIVWDRPLPPATMEDLAVVE